MKSRTAGLVASVSYSSLLSSVGELLEAARRASARTVNAFMTATYWEVGRRLNDRIVPVKVSQNRGRPARYFACSA